MNKKYITGLLALTLIIPATSNAATLSNKTISGPTIAILDTAIDTSIPQLQGRVIYEACITEWGGCAGGVFQAEGPGSASLPKDVVSKNGFDHGTQMSSVAVQTNSNVNIVFVKIVGTSRLGLRQPVGEKSVNNALQWIIDNKDKFNIQSVAMSQGHHNLGAAGTDYCPKTPNTQLLIDKLKSSNVPVFFPTGNIVPADTSRIDWPACIPNSIAVGAILPAGEVAVYSNYDAKLTDFVALGTMKTATVGGAIVPIAGTSAANIVAATNWATLKSAKPNLTYDQLYSLLSSTAKITKNSKVTGAKLIDIKAELNG
jgi:hypothetical protein